MNPLKSSRYPQQLVFLKIIFNHLSDLKDRVASRAISFFKACRSNAVLNRMLQIQ